MFPYRYLILVIVLLLAVFCIHFAADRYLQKTSEHLLTYTDEIKNYMMVRNWPKAQQSFQEFQTLWKEAMPIWSLFLDHPEMDNLHMSIAKLSSYLNTQSTPDALAENNTIERLIEHLPEKERIYWKNIL